MAAQQRALALNRFDTTAPHLDYFSLSHRLDQRAGSSVRLPARCRFCITGNCLACYLQCGPDEMESSGWIDLPEVWLFQALSSFGGRLIPHAPWQLKGGARITTGSPGE